MKRFLLYGARGQRQKFEFVEVFLDLFFRLQLMHQADEDGVFRFLFDAFFIFFAYIPIFPHSLFIDFFVFPIRALRQSFSAGLPNRSD
jgi:hypothetical protein